MPEPAGLSEGPQDSSRTDAAASSNISEVTPWSVEERSAYVRSLGVATGPHENSVLLLLEDAISDAPLPPPWVMSRTETGAPFWFDQVDQESSWSHPLESALRELAGVCQACLSLDVSGRAPCLYSLKQAWEEEAKQQLDKWCRAADPEGREYYWHSDSKEVTWEHPGEKILPMYYVKMKILARLQEGDGEPETPEESADGSSKQPRYSFKEELEHLDLDIQTKEPPGGLESAAIEPKFSSEGLWWWGCSPIQYVDTQVQEKAYVKGAIEGKQLYSKRMATITQKELTNGASGEGTELNTRKSTPEGKVV